jgi:hypothetical protein
VAETVLVIQGLSLLPSGERGASGAVSCLGSHADPSGLTNWRRSADRQVLLRLRVNVNSVRTETPAAYVMLSGHPR